MGFELELAGVAGHLRDPGPASGLLHPRWVAANRRLAAALAGYRALRGRLAPGDPAWLGAQLSIAEARQRCREIEDALLAEGESFELGL